jgi:hypothetical protein
MRLATLLLLALLTLAPTVQALEVGYNQGWIIDQWGRDLTRGFDAAQWQRVIARTKASGGSVLRVWLCEGAAKEGVVWDGARPLTVDPAFLSNIQTVIDLARASGVKLYWTLFDGNWADGWPRGSIDHFRHYNILANKYGAGDEFKRNVLAPILDVIGPAADVTWAVDLMNEVQGSVRSWMWSDGWAGCRRWTRDWTAFAHRRVPGLRVTVSSGHHTAVDDIIEGRLDGLGLDFYDVHVYSDAGRVPSGWRLAAHAAARGRQVVLGEFGQKTTTVDAGLQAQVTERFLADARRLGFAAALAWRIEDWQSNGLHFTFWERDGRPRPAVEVMRRHARMP